MRGIWVCCVCVHSSGCCEISLVFDSICFLGCSWMCTGLSQDVWLMTQSTGIGIPFWFVISHS